MWAIPWAGGCRDSWADRLTMRTVQWEHELKQQQEICSLHWHVLSPLRGSPRLKPRPVDERLALALAARMAVQSGRVVEFLGEHRWRLVVQHG